MRHTRVALVTVVQTFALPIHANDGFRLWLYPSYVPLIDQLRLDHHVEHVGDRRRIRRHRIGLVELLQPQHLALAGAELEALDVAVKRLPFARSEEHTSELQSLMRKSYAVFRLKKKQTI